MNERDLVPSGTLANQYGVKSLVFGPPGSAKTPTITTAPRPVLLAVEPGMLSMRGTNIPTRDAPKWAEIKDFFAWLKSSSEARNYDTVGIDSVSQICEVHIRDNPHKVSHGLQQYGKMADDVYKELYDLFYMKQKHVYLICKQEIVKLDSGTLMRPYFPGQALPTLVPHLYDEILQLDLHSIPGVGQARAFRCWGGFGVNCRDRSGKLAEFEPPNLTALFNKCMS